MIWRKTLTDSFPSISWSILLIGVSQMTMMIIGVGEVLLSVIGCSLLSAIFFTYYLKGPSLPKAVAIAHLQISLLMMIGNLVFHFLMNITWSPRWIGFHAVAAIVFFACGLLFSAIISKVFNVSR